MTKSVQQSKTPTSVQTCVSTEVCRPVGGQNELTHSLPDWMTKEDVGCRRMPAKLLCLTCSREAFSIRSSMPGCRCFTLPDCTCNSRHAHMTAHATAGMQTLLDCTCFTWLDCSCNRRHTHMLCLRLHARVRCA